MTHDMGVSAADQQAAQEVAEALIAASGGTLSDGFYGVLPPGNASTWVAIDLANGMPTVEASCDVGRPLTPQEEAGLAALGFTVHGDPATLQFVDSNLSPVQLVQVAAMIAVQAISTVYRPFLEESGDWGLPGRWSADKFA